MTRFFTSDLHLLHERISIYCPSRLTLGATTAERTHVLIARLNSAIQPQDEIMMLGDICMGKLDISVPLVSQLNGGKYLLEGNHDRKSVKRDDFCKNFVWIKTEHEEQVEILGRKIALKMRHYPPSYEEMTVKNEHEHRTFMSNTYWLFGHRHGNVAHDPRLPCLDVGVDAQDYLPVSYERVLEHIRIYLQHLDAGEVKVPYFETPDYDKPQEVHG